MTKFDIFNKMYKRFEKISSFTNLFDWANAYSEGYEGSGSQAKCSYFIRFLNRFYGKSNSQIEEEN